MVTHIVHPNAKIALVVAILGIVFERSRGLFEQFDIPAEKENERQEKKRESKSKRRTIQNCTSFSLSLRTLDATKRRMRLDARYANALATRPEGR